MRTFPRRSDRSIKPLWVLPLALLTLPNCKFDPQGEVRVHAGSTVVFCDLNLEDTERECATSEDDGIRLNRAAIALVQGENGKILGIDDSPQARAQCGGHPQKILFRGEYPAGTPVCVNGEFIGAGKLYSDTTGVCVAKCLDVITSETSATPDQVAFCASRAQASTNVPAIPDASVVGCSTGGNPIADFADPRLAGEFVDWINTDGKVTVVGQNLVRTDNACPTPPCIFVGAAGSKPATHGDGYLEFSLIEQTTNRVAGLTTGPGADDHDGNFATIGFGIDFFRDGCFYVFENGVPQTAPAPLAECALPNNAFGHYFSGDRFRIDFFDNFDGTAIIFYSKLQGPCTPGHECPALPFFASLARGAYPLHPDASFEDDNGQLVDVRLVYIH